MPTSSKNAKEPTSTHHATTLALITSLEQNRAELLTTLREIGSLRQKEENLRAHITSTENLLLRIQPKPRAAVFDTPELMHLILSFAHSSEFIKHGCVCYPLSMDRTELGSQTLPIIIATVCKQWRRIAFAMTTLWSTIVIRTYGHRRATCVPYLRRLDLYLIRSGSQPLTIFIEGTQPDSCSTIPLSPSSSRRKMEICTSGHISIFN
ncbi:hypothetical protein DL96DRAFT_598966 [Flagelloscypha sp. PMI_526]|nr:hypothetical protein DL96DRAFT_598966 [Flagelloscypha sp. PMI_526]